MDTVQVAQHLVVEFCQLLIDADDRILLALVSLLPLGTAFTVLTLVVFLCSAKLVPFYRRGFQKIKPFSVGTDHVPLVVNSTRS